MSPQLQENSLYMNDLNEKKHHTVDRMYSMIEEDNPNLKHEEIMAHPLHAKNLHMFLRFTS